MHLENDLVIANKVHVDYSKEFGEVGDTIQIDRPVRFDGQSDNLDVSSYNEDIIMGKETITLDKTETIKFKLTSKEKTLDVRSNRMQDIITAATTKMRDKVETSLAALYPALYHFGGTPGTVPSTFKSLASAGAVLTDQAVPTQGRFAIHGPDTGVELADGLKNVFVQDKARTAFEEATIGRYGTFDNYMSVHAPTHTVGDHGGTPLVRGANQSVTYLAAKDTKSMTFATDGWPNSTTGVLKAGDVFTIADVFAVNPITLESTGRLQTFTVLADADSNGSGQADVTISPAIIPASATLANGKAYATVDSVPANDAAITVKSGNANASYRQSLLMTKNAFALVTRALDIPSGAGVKTSTKTGNRMTISCTEWVDGNTLDHNFRFDILYGVKVIDERCGYRLTA